MSLLGALAGGFVGTILLTSGMRAATAFHQTRMDLPFLLGTAFTEDRRKAKAVGYAAHFGFGLLFALAYWADFSAIDQAGWLLGTAFGLVHALFAGSALVNVLLPVVHLRMGTGFDAAGATPLLEPPGFMLANYGRNTAVVTVIAHLAYGAIVGAFAAGL